MVAETSSNVIAAAPRIYHRGMDLIEADRNYMVASGYVRLGTVTNAVSVVAD